MPQTPSPETPNEYDGPWRPVYFAFNQAEAEYIIAYLDSSDIDAESEPDPEHEGYYWVLVPDEDARRALQVVAKEREGQLDEKGVEAIRSAMTFSGGQLSVIAIWSLLLLGLIVAASLFLSRGN